MQNLIEFIIALLFNCWSLHIRTESGLLKLIFFLITNQPTRSDALIVAGYTMHTHLHKYLYPEMMGLPSKF